LGFFSLIQINSRSIPTRVPEGTAFQPFHFLLPASPSLPLIWLASVCTRNTFQDLLRGPVDSKMGNDKRVAFSCFPQRLFLGKGAGEWLQ
jgi:hypothetical protein